MKTPNTVNIQSRYPSHYNNITGSVVIILTGLNILFAGKAIDE
jgi:hypothetical protein